MSDYSPSHERANIATHIIGFVLGIVAIPFLIYHAVDSDFSNQVTVIGLLIYGVSFLMVFGFSSLYHYHREPKRRHLMKIWDHISIYYLIAGTYTPFILAYANKADVQLMLLVLWTLALAGTIFKFFFAGKFRVVSTAIYLAMGWMIVGAPDSFKDTMTDNSVFWIGVGGVFYTLGVVFYLVKKIPYHHAIWHVFVLGGAVSHLIGVWGIYQ
ncbi:hemolysin III family protein [Cryomorpha ignava]|uniref:Hemolysin III family protein n=1 Tax=Cryomorpha ignava TaxID=101383 RepID=A0A7K3WTP5_9FLAO|nr:hemolysin III family protein [Cryomorpha ignava]NEN25063.1 hemolysin III family protein [Cryomorpha ignava]